MSKLLSALQQPNYCYVIAEAGLNHNGSVETAKRLIDVAVVSGADAVKFQKRTVDELAIKDILDAPDSRFPSFGTTYREVRRHLELNEADYQVLIEYCEKRGIDFLCTAFDIPAAKFLEKLSVDMYKLASAGLTNLPLLEYVAALKKPTILSTGGAEWDDVDRAFKIFDEAGTPFALLHCVAEYPTTIQNANVRMIESLKERYTHVPIGFSGHELGFLPTLLAVAAGAQIVERHFTLSKQQEGFDHGISLEPDELIAMIREIRKIPVILGTGEKHLLPGELLKMNQYHVSMVSAQPIARGTRITAEMITYRNPGTGIPPKEAASIIGQVAGVDIPVDTLIAREMVKAGEPARI